MLTGETAFSVLCSLFTWIQRSKTAAKKRSKLRKFLDTFCDPGDYFSAIRLILPSLDRERGTYGLKESVLATCLIDALGMSRESEDAVRLINWRKGGARTGSNAGNFALVASEILQRRQGMTSGGLTIKELNGLLDRLASSESRAEKTSLLSTLIKKTNAQEMKWVVMIILKDLKLGISEKSVFHEFHPDAEDLFNVTCDLKLICEKLRDRSQRHKRQDIEVGKPVRPQLAARVGDATAAWKKLHGKEVVAECKFDGDRIQIHKNGSEIHFFSRNFLDHPEYGHAMSQFIEKNILVERCILDGEMLVWDVSLNRFAEFGSNQEIAKAAKEGFDSDRQLCYVAFDILYAGDTSVIHQSLKERHELLRKIVKPLKGRLEILVPYGGLNTQRTSGEPCWSLIVCTVDDVQKFFKETIENRDEGIVLKDAGSKWEPGDRSGKWLKLKPDYIRAGSDLDVLIIGGYYGSGRRGGEVAQFLVGLAERSDASVYPKRFISFCRVGTGLSDEELDAVVTKLKPYFRRYEYPKKLAPSFYQVTNNSKERPDVWIDSPEKSIILSITSDIRTIRSGVFAAPYSLRFPRVDRVRWDKPWHECLDVQSFVELVRSSNGTTHGEANNGVSQISKSKHMKPSKKERMKTSVVPSHFVQTDVSGVRGRGTLIFSSMLFYFVNVPKGHSLASLHKMVVENGGAFSMNLNNSVTHCVAAESKGIKYQAAKRYGDIIHYLWVLDCCSQQKLLPLRPKHFLFLSDASKRKLQEEIDEYSDSYFWDIDLKDLKQLLSSIDRQEDTQNVVYYKNKYCPKEKWSQFHDCCIYFYLGHPLNVDWRTVLELSMRRMKIEVAVRGGEVGTKLANATHLVVLSVPHFNVEFDAILESFSISEKHILCSKRLHIVGAEWVEDCLVRERKLQEDAYSLKPNSSIESIREWKNEVEVPSSMDPLENQNITSSPYKEKNKTSVKTATKTPKKLTSTIDDNKRKRGRPTGTKGARGGRSGVPRVQRTRARLGKKQAKIYESGSEESTFPENRHDAKREAGEFHDRVGMESGDTLHHKISENPQSPQRGMVVPKEEGEKDGSHESNLIGGDEDKGMAKHEKLEVMFDPFQAILLDMVPSLGMANPTLSKEKQLAKTDTELANTELPDAELVNTELANTEPLSEDQIAPWDPETQPVKKKKVSYKDIAGELLKDW